MINEPTVTIDVILMLLMKKVTNGATDTFDEILRSGYCDICNPFLALFRRFVPQLGPLDLSPIVAIITLELINAFIVGDLIHG